jgi:alpha-methylacyl-CoA racemase
MSGPLTGMRVIELEGRGPAPFGAMILADLGAEVVRITRPAPAASASASSPGDGGSGENGGGDAPSDTQRMISGQRRIDPVLRGRRTVAADLKDPAGRSAVRKLIDRADVLVEGFRPGVTERLGLGPEACTERNPRLIYARITGWGQDGPLRDVPGHDINYVALAGVLDALPRAGGEPPRPPLNLLGDYGGGGMLLVTGVLAALVERAVSGRGQVVDVAMTDGVALLTTLLHGMRAEGLFPGKPGTSVLGLDAPFYNVYETADGRHVSVGCGEPQFYAKLLDALGIAGDERAGLLTGQADPDTWPAGKARLAEVFRSKTREEWSGLLEGTDICFAPVLSLDEAPEHPHFQARGTYLTSGGVTQPAPAPRFSRTPAGKPAETETLSIDALMRDWET